MPAGPSAPVLAHPVWPVVLMAALGAACWQPVRFAGQGCGWTMGLLWGLAWYFLSCAQGGGKRRPYGSPVMVLAFVAGFYFGGMHGYGQFHFWIKGVFELDRAAGQTVPLSPVLGYFWVFLCGAGWGGVAGAFLVWGGTGRVGVGGWMLRAVLVAAFAILFRSLAVLRPEWVMPLYGAVNYGDSAVCPDCTRTVGTLVQSMMWLGFYTGAFAAELVRRDFRRALFLLAMGGGFGVAFTAFEWLHLFTDAQNEPVYWWSLWEASNGLIGGAVLGLCFWWFNRPGAEPEASPLWVRWPRAAVALGLGLPLFASIYHVIPFRVARGARWFGLDEEAARAGAQYGALAVIGVLALWGLVWLRRTPAGAMPFGRRPAGWLFVSVYTVYFLVSYIPRFALYGKTAGIPITQSVYALAFAISLIAFARMMGRPAPGDMPS